MNVIDAYVKENEYDNPVVELVNISHSPYFIRGIKLEPNEYILIEYNLAVTLMGMMDKNKLEIRR